MMRKKEKGFTLLVSIVTTSILLIVSFAVANVALKQLVNTILNKESQIAFFNSESAIECALFWDLKNPDDATGRSAFDLISTVTPDCGGNNNIAVTRTAGSGTTISTATFTVNYPKGYSQVTVLKKTDGTTNINSYGYNTTASGVSRKFERGVTLNYDSPVSPSTDTCPNVTGEQTTTPCLDTVCTSGGGVWNIGTQHCDHLPIVTTNSASSVNSTDATLNGTVNPNTVTPATGWFRYFTTSQCNDIGGTRAPSSGGTNFNSTGSYNNLISGLTSATTYYYCAIASNADGTTLGDIVSFVTGASSFWVTPGTGVNISTNNLTKTLATSGWNAGTVSTQSINSGDGYIQFTTAENTLNKFGGLNNGNADNDIVDIDFGLFVMNNPEVRIYENNVCKYGAGSCTVTGGVMTYSAGNIFTIAVTSGVVRYYLGNILLYTSSVSPSYPLLFDTSLYNQNATLNNASITSGTYTPLPYDVDYLVVGGGGGGAVGNNGGGSGGGGGGGGGVIAGSTTFTPGGSSYVITVGAGGLAFNDCSSFPVGGASSIGSLVSVSGGGHGGLGGCGPSYGGNGGSGGGGARGAVSGTGIAGQGNNGGAGGSSPSGGGGGGGKGGAGIAGGSMNGGAGGAGYSSSLSGSSITYGGGGGGGSADSDYCNSGSSGGAGNGGGGNGGTCSNGSPGASNRGGGGGGAGASNNVGSSNFGAGGGSGVVIIRYRGALRGSGGTITYTDSNGLNPRSSPPYSGGYTVHTFTTPGGIFQP